MRYKTRSVEVEALRLSFGEKNSIDEWDEVCEFLGASWLSGKDESDRIRVQRPPLRRRGNVEVAYTPPGSDTCFAYAGNWLVKRNGALLFMSDETFRAEYEKV